MNRVFLFVDRKFYSSSILSSTLVTIIQKENKLLDKSGRNLA